MYCLSSIQHWDEPRLTRNNLIMERIGKGAYAVQIKQARVVVARLSWL